MPEQLQEKYCVSLKIQSSIGSTSTYLSLGLHRKSVVVDNYAATEINEKHTQCLSWRNKSILRKRITVSVFHLSFGEKKVDKKTMQHRHCDEELNRKTE